MSEKFRELGSEVHVASGPELGTGAAET
jgi:hypothetical protein